MRDIFLWAIVVLFAVSTLALAAYGLHLYVLLWLFRRRVRGARQRQREVIKAYRADRSTDDWPVVTTQIPVYNELDVVRRIIDATASMNYPADRHEIQVLDDSTDRTRELVDEAVTRWRARGVDIKAVRRPDRTGYKAGALSHGLATARGKYVAIFDADFVPPRDFLVTAVPLLESSPNTACLQGRWDHLNRNESWLTEAQALGIDGHFAIEQGARAWNGLMMNFNGTAGVWRRAAIDDPRVGGWSGDTLTEDLDLSYRAQLAGWTIDYCMDLPCPAELPGTVAALKTQQARWATGSIQVACKLLPRIWRSPLSLGKKVEATLHLTHYSVAVWMLLVAVVARPMLLVHANGLLAYRLLWAVWIGILFSAVAPSLVYTYARYVFGGRWSGLRQIPPMMALGCGMCLNNAVAVCRGLFRRGGEFVRTPKSGSAGESVRPSSYRAVLNHLWMVELLLGTYCLLSFLFYFRDLHRMFSFFLLIYAVGFTLIGWASRPRKPRRMPESADIGPVLGAAVPAAAESAGAT